MFVDPDDRVEPYYLQSLYDSVAGTKSNVGIGGFRQKDVRSGELQDFRMKENKKRFLLQNVIILLWLSGICAME